MNSTRTISNKRTARKSQTYGYVNLRGEIETFTSIMNFEYVVLTPIGAFGGSCRNKFHDLERAQADARRKSRDFSGIVIREVLPQERFAEFAPLQESLKNVAQDCDSRKQAAFAASDRKVAIRKNIRPFNS